MPTLSGITTMSNAQANQLFAMSRKLIDIASQLEKLWSGYNCDCEGQCPVCRRLIDLASDADNLADECQHAANADTEREAMSAA
jgi:hypothetical protein